MHQLQGHAAIQQPGRQILSLLISPFVVSLPATYVVIALWEVHSLRPAALAQHLALVPVTVVFCVLTALLEASEQRRGVSLWKTPWRLPAHCVLYAGFFGFAIHVVGPLFFH
ncbi:MAG: hypothetical protein ACRD8A_12625 [Candidatus Acidiferrales bacterium]